jgi:hypothetical protein
MPRLLKSSFAALVFCCTSCGPGGRERVDGGGPADARADAGPTVDSLPPDFSRVYAHSGTILYRVDTTTLEPTVVGSITNLGTQSLTDLAIDEDDNMYGVTLDKLFTIDPATGAATLVTEFESGTPNFTSLSFVPVDPSAPSGPERLVAATDDGTIYEIDRTSGEVTSIGSYGTDDGGDAIVSSGDLMGVRGFGIYATVNVGEPFSSPDYLARIDPVTWQATPIGAGTTFDRIFGIGFWKGTLYGFVDLGDGLGGRIVELDPTTGASTSVNSSDIRWYGAGVTTDAPVVE